jgi:methionyl-tRNA formyltransferase
VKIVFFGTDFFAKEILQFLLEKKVFIAAVVTRPDKPKGRAQKLLPPPVKQLLEDCKSNIPLFQPIKASAPEFIEEIKKFEPDLFVVVSYGQIIREALLSLPRLGAINVHPSLLPKFRGPSPIQSAVLAGDKETAVTIMKMDLEMDTGDIIKAKKVPLPEDMTYGELELVLCNKAKDLLLDVLLEIEKKGKVEGIEQEHSAATYTQKITPELGFINWNAPSKEIVNLVRGMDPKPGAKCFIEVNGEKKELKIFQAVALPQEKSKKPKEFISCNAKQGLIVATQDGAVQIISVQLEGKKRMTTKDFLNGFTGSFHLL